MELDSTTVARSRVTIGAHIRPSHMSKSQTWDTPDFISWYLPLCSLQSSYEAFLRGDIRAPLTRACFGPHSLTETYHWGHCYQDMCGTLHCRQMGIFIIQAPMGALIL